MITARRENQVIALIEAGLSVAEIADELGVSINSARTYRRLVNKTRRSADGAFLTAPAGDCAPDKPRDQWTAQERATRPCPKNWPADPERYRAGVAG